MDQIKKAAPEISGAVSSPKKSNKNRWIKPLLWLIIIFIVVYMGVEIINMSKQQGVNLEQSSSTSGQNQGGGLMQGLDNSGTGGPPPSDFGGAPPSAAAGSASGDNAPSAN